MAEFYSRWEPRRNLVIKLILFLSGPETPFPLGVFTNAGLHHATGQWWIWGPDGRMADAGPVTQAPNTGWWPPPPLHWECSSPNEILQLGCFRIQTRGLKTEKQLYSYILGLNINAPLFLKRDAPNFSRSIWGKSYHPRFLFLVT